MSSGLLILAHPNLAESKINRHLIAALQAQNQPPLLHDLYARYANFEIDVAAEQDLLTQSQRIIVQFPLYWYSSPALLKHWFDLVWLRHFAYGKQAKALAGKTLQLVVTAGGPQQSYEPAGKNQFSVSDFLKPFAQTANFCDMHYAQPLILHNGYGLSELDLQSFTQTYLELLA